MTEIAEGRVLVRVLTGAIREHEWAFQNAAALGTYYDETFRNLRDAETALEDWFKKIERALADNRH